MGRQKRPVDAPELSPPLDPPRTPAHELADKLIEVVRSHEAGGHRSDAADQVMVAAYVKGLRRFIAIRRLAGLGAGPEAMILARSLLSMVARATYVAGPVDPIVRRERWHEFARSDRKRVIEALEGLRTAGFDIEESEIDEVRGELLELGEGRSLPGDKQLLETVGLSAYYHRLYRIGSDFVHFGLGLSIDEVAGDVEHVQLDAGEDDVADEALVLACLVYATLIHVSDRAVEHGLGDDVKDLVTSSPAFASDIS